MTCSTCLFIIAIITVFLVLVKVYTKLTSKWCTSKVCLVGKTIIVTGANTGIGYEAALEFAKRGARVILACRDKSRATAAQDRIIRLTENKNVIVKLVDLSSLQSVRNFAKDVVETEQRLDILVNNAGIGRADDEQTEDGFDFLIQANYFGPFLLTLLLIDKLKKSTPSRIINVSSMGASFAKLDVDNVNSYAGPSYSYYNSKLCNVLFTMHLAKLLEKHDITVYSLHPGVVKTEFFRTYQGRRKVIATAVQPFMKTCEEGAQTIIYTAIEQGIEHLSGGHFAECQVVKTYKTAQDPSLPKKLWDKSLELLKLEKEAKNI